MKKRKKLGGPGVAQLVARACSYYPDVEAEATNIVHLEVLVADEEAQAIEALIRAAISDNQQMLERFERCLDQRREEQFGE